MYFKDGDKKMSYASEQENSEKRDWELDPFEEISMKFVDLVYDVLELQKLRKKDTKIIVTIAEHMAEMFRGSQDLSLLTEIVSTAVEALSNKVNKQPKPAGKQKEPSVSFPVEVIESPKSDNIALLGD